MSAFIKDMPFFKNLGITGRDLLDVCEYLTYEQAEEGDKIIEFGTNTDEMYFVLDGTVDFFVDLKQNEMRSKQVDELCNDLSLNKKEIIKQILEFKDRTGLNSSTALDITKIQSSLAQ